MQRWRQASAWLSRGKFPAPEFAHAAAIFRLQRFGVAGPRLLAMGHRRLGPWQPPQRYWRGAEAEWDLVADAVHGARTLVGEAWFSHRPVTVAVARREAARLAVRPLPPPCSGRDCIRALLVPTLAAGTPRIIGTVHLVDLAELT